ncbi:MAG: hypothetical protein HY453_01970 [Parcubacteria group bacterium]|nr:hypothetical protein [Parcubacteria group bacterium]
MSKFSLWQIAVAAAGGLAIVTIGAYIATRPGKPTVSPPSDMISPDASKAVPSGPGVSTGKDVPLPPPNPSTTLKNVSLPAKPSPTSNTNQGIVPSPTSDTGKTETEKAPDQAPSAGIAANQISGRWAGTMTLPVLGYCSGGSTSWTSSFENPSGENDTDLKGMIYDSENAVLSDIIAMKDAGGTWTIKDGDTVENLVITGTISLGNSGKPSVSGSYQLPSKYCPGQSVVNPGKPESPVSGTFTGSKQ